MESSGLSGESPDSRENHPNGAGPAAEGTTGPSRQRDAPAADGGQGGYRVARFSTGT